MSYRGPSNGGISSMGKRDRDDGDDEEGDDKKKKLGFTIPKPLFPVRRDIPPLPTIDIHNYNMLTTIIKLKQNMPYSIYNLNQDKLNTKDGVERYSDRFLEKKKENPNSIELNLPGIKFGYFPYDLITIKKKTKKRAKNTGKTLEELQKLEREGAEDDENAEEDEEEEEEEADGDYGEEMGNDDDSDGGGDSDDGGEANFNQ